MSYYIISASALRSQLHRRPCESQRPCTCNNPGGKHTSLMCLAQFAPTHSPWMAALSDLPFCAASLSVTQSHSGAHVAR